MYPDRDTLSNIPRSGYIAAQRTLESGETEGGINTARPCHWLAVFFLVNEHNNTMKPKAKKQRFSKLSQKRNSSYSREKMQIIYGKELCKSIIQWF